MSEQRPRAVRASAQGECQCNNPFPLNFLHADHKGGCSRDAQGSADLPQCRRGAVSPSSISGLIHFAHDRKQDSANTRAYSYEHTQSKRRLQYRDNSIASYTYNKMLSTIHYEFIRAFYYAIIRLLPHRVSSRSVYHIPSHRFPRISHRDTRRSRYCILYITYFSITQYSTVYRYKSASVSVITHVYMQQDDAQVAFRAPLPEAEDEASQGETTSVETPEGRFQRLDARESRRDRDREVNLRHTRTCTRVRLRVYRC